MGIFTGLLHDDESLVSDKLWNIKLSEEISLQIILRLFYMKKFDYYASQAKNMREINNCLENRQHSY